MLGGSHTCQRYVEATKELRAERKSRKEAVFGSGILDLEGLQADAEDLLRCREDDTVEVLTAVPYRAVRGVAQACKDGELEKQDLPMWTQKTAAKGRSQTLAGHEVRNAFMKSIMWQNTEFFRRVVGEVDARGVLTFTLCMRALRDVLCRGLVVVDNGQPR